MHGFKPQEMASLLQIHKETFRYWRANLDPNPNRSKFNSRDLLVYRLIKFFVKQHGEPPKTLKNCGITRIFESIGSHDIETLRESLILLDTDRGCIEFLTLDRSPSKFGFGIHYVPFAPVVDEHKNALLSFGV